MLEGDNVSIYYDPMIAKLVVHGPDRMTALAKFKRALAEYNIAGLRTNVKFCQDICDHPGFEAGELSTTFIDDNEAVLFKVAPPSRNVKRQRAEL